MATEEELHARRQAQQDMAKALFRRSAMTASEKVAEAEQLLLEAISTISDRDARDLLTEKATLLVRGVHIDLDLHDRTSKQLRLNVGGLLLAAQSGDPNWF